MIVSILAGREIALADEPQYHAFIKSIAEDITVLKKTHPQLKEFSADKHVDIENLRIDYGYHTYEPERTGGWTSGVPNPNPDGVWFYIDLHEKDSTAQIHTQPITSPSLQFGDKQVGFLILEGAETPSIADELISILDQHGAKAEKP